MARRVGSRIQVFVSPEAANEIESIAKAEGVSLSRVVGDAFESHRSTDEYKHRLLMANARLDSAKKAVLGALDGVNLSQDKLQAIMSALEDMKS